MSKEEELEQQLADVIIERDELSDSLRNVTNERDELQSQIYRKEELIKKLDSLFNNNKSALDGKQYELDTANRKIRDLEDRISRLKTGRW